MNRSRRRRFLVMIAIGVTAAVGCGRHRVATSFAELSPRLKTGQTIYLTTVNGEVQKGALEDISDAGARIRMSGATLQHLERDTAQIAVPQPLWHGAVIGALTGAALGSAAADVARAPACFFGDEAACEPSARVGGLLVGAGLGTAIGIGIDALVWKRTTVFTASQATPTRIVLAPLVRRHGAGLRIIATF
jgi:hypothetical protein